MGEGERGDSAGVRAGEAVQEQGTGGRRGFRQGKCSQRRKKGIGRDGKGRAGWGKGTGEGTADIRGRPGVNQRPRAGQRGVEEWHVVEVTAAEGKEGEVDNEDRRWGSGGGSEEGVGEGEGDAYVQR